MPTESDAKLEIGHLLFIDIVGYSKLLIAIADQLQAKNCHFARAEELSPGLPSKQVE